jgi:hypothetical protein
LTPSLLGHQKHYPDPFFDQRLLNLTIFDPYSQTAFSFQHNDP